MGFFSTSIYGEYGLTDQLTIQLYAPIFNRNYHNNQVSQATGETFIAGEALNGIGDFDITFKHGLSKPGSKVATAVSWTFGLPFGKTEGSTLRNLQLGDGEFNMMLRLDVGTGWNIGNTSMYGNVYAGFNNRTNNFSDEFRAGLEIGAQFLDQKLLFISRLNVVESLKNGVPSGLNIGASLFANNSEFTSVELELAYNVQDNWGVSVGYGSAVRGELIFASASYNVGVFVKI